MNNTELQDFDEELVFSEFRSVYPILGVVRKKRKNQKPDVIIDQNGKILGIEITRIRSKEHPVYGSQRQFALALKKYLNCTLNNHVGVQLFFKSPIIIRANEKNDHAKKVAQIIADQSKQILSSEGVKSIIIDSCASNIGLEEIEVISAYSNDENIYKESEVTIASSGWINMYFVDEIKESIEKKNRKYYEYMKVVDECWLLIYSDTFRTEGLFNFSEDMKKEKYNSVFSKTIYYEFRNQKYFEIC